ncbi:hypothetical protein TNCV_2376021 [Trichonephila clavipes]|nr:hypothetical protein TNCV_2376021 [Trichonephila clavipes]
MDAGCHWEMEREAFLHPISRLLMWPGCGWACLRESVLISGSNMARRRGYRIGIFLQYSFGGNVLMLSMKGPAVIGLRHCESRHSIGCTDALEQFKGV